MLVDMVMGVGMVGLVERLGELEHRASLGGFMHGGEGCTRLIMGGGIIGGGSGGDSRTLGSSLLVIAGVVKSTSWSLIGSECIHSVARTSFYIIVILCLHPPEHLLRDTRGSLQSDCVPYLLIVIPTTIFCSQ
jgi:hypothetical protein